MIKYRPYVYALLATVFTTPGQILYKVGAERLPDIVTNWPLALAVILYVAAAVFFILALRHGDLARVFPILATSYIWIALAGYFLFEETVTIMNWAGIALVMLGVCCIAFGENK